MNVVLLHGALGSASDFDALRLHFPKEWKIHSFDFINHGNGPFSDNPLSIQAFGEQLINFLHQNSLIKVNVFGYSMGGYVASWVAFKKPILIGKIYSLGTKFIWDEESAQIESAKLDPTIIEARFPEYAHSLNQKHCVISWKLLLHYTAELMLQLGTSPAMKYEEFQENTCQVHLVRGEHDKMVTDDQIVKTLNLLKPEISSKEILPATAHPIDRVNPQLLAESIKEFFEK
jgi:pimeloyl-ACP methyl ester carboxylesterase